jgi:FkbM family methyltransferase
MLALLLLVLFSVGLWDLSQCIQKEGLLSNMAWLQWPSLRSHIPEPMDKNVVYDAVQALKGLNDPFLNLKLHRVDRYVLNTFGEEFLFAWTSTVCHALNHSAWRDTNGHEFAALLASELHKLRHAHIFRDNSQVALDIGAHVGDSTIPIAFMARKTIAFEPSSHSFSFLRANVALNPHLNISIHKLAIGPAAGEAIVKYVTDDTSVEAECNAVIQNSDASYVVPSNEERKKAEAHVPMVKLDTFLRETYGEDIIRSIGYIKIDAAGFDSTVLNSIHDLLSATQHFPVIQVDYLFSKDIISIDSSAKFLFAAIQSLPGKYKPYCVAGCPSDGTDRGILSKCPMALHEILINTQPDTVSGDQAVVGVSFKTSNGPDKMCDDLLLYPADFHKMPYVN